MGNNYEGEFVSNFSISVKIFTGIPYIIFLIFLYARYIVYILEFISIYINYCDIESKFFYISYF